MSVSPEEKSNIFRRISKNEEKNIRMEEKQKTFENEISKVVVSLGKVSDLLWKDGLAKAVSENTKFRLKQWDKRDKIIGSIRDIIFTIFLGYVAWKVGLIPH